MQTRSLPFTAALAVLALTIVGCTGEAWYEGAKRSAESQCRQQPPSELQACLERVNKESYASYERQRSTLK